MKELIALLCLVLATSSPLAFASEEGADGNSSANKKRNTHFRFS